MTFRFPPRSTDAPAVEVDDPGDLADLAELDTTPYGRSLLEMPDGPSTRSYIGVTAITDALEGDTTQLEDLIADLTSRVTDLEQGLTGGDGRLIPLYDVVQWTNMPSTLSEWWQYGRVRADLAGMVYARFTTTVSIVAGTGAWLKAQYSADNGSNWADLTTTCAIDSLGSHSSTWMTIPAAARGDVLIRWVGDDSNGTADPEFYQPTVEVRQTPPSPAMSGGAGGGGGGDGVTYASIATWVDDFGGNLDAYTAVGTVSLTGGSDDQLSLTPLVNPGSYIDTEAFYSWPDQAGVYFTVDDPSVGVTTYGGVEIRSSDTNKIAVTVNNSGGELWYRLTQPGGSVTDVQVDATWDSTAQRVIRLRRNASNFEIHAGSDGSNWGSALATVAIPATFDTARVTGRVVAAYWGSEPSPRPFLISGINSFQAAPQDPPPDPGDGVLLREYNFDTASNGNPFPVLEQPTGSTSLSRVTSPNPPGDRTYSGLFRHNSNSQRIEGTDYAYRFASGDEVWIGMSIYLPSSLAAQFDSGHHTLMQFKQGPNTGGGGPMELDFRKDGAGGWTDGLHFMYGGTSVLVASEANAYNTWHNLQFRAKFSHSAGQFEVWRNDVNILPTVSGIDTLGSGPDYVYIKFGNYGNYTSWPVDVNISNIRFGTTRSIVRPPGT